MSNKQDIRALRDRVRRLETAMALQPCPDKVEAAEMASHLRKDLRSLVESIRKQAQEPEPRPAWQEILDGVYCLEVRVGPGGTAYLPALRGVVTEIAGPLADNLARMANVAGCVILEYRRQGTPIPWEEPDAIPPLNASEYVRHITVDIRDELAKQEPERTCPYCGGEVELNNNSEHVEPPYSHWWSCEGTTERRCSASGPCCATPDTAYDAWWVPFRFKQRAGELHKENRTLRDQLAKALADRDKSQADALQAKLTLGAFKVRTAELEQGLASPCLDCGSKTKMIRQLQQQLAEAGKEVRGKSVLVETYSACELSPCRKGDEYGTQFVVRDAVVTVLQR